MSKKQSIDKILLINFLIIIFLGLIIFFSASLGLLARNGAKFGSVASSQIGLGILIGGITAFFISNIPYKKIGKYSCYIWIFAVLMTFSVFIPQLGFAHNGAQRWISVFGFTLQPSEFLKIAYIIFLSAWLSRNKAEIKTFRGGFLPFVIISLISSLPLVLQPDMGTILLMLAAGFGIYFISGASWKHIGISFLLAIISGIILVSFKPYILDRMLTFIDPSRDELGSGYQVQQSLIAVGSGGLAGRGFGQSIQKFNYLPEPYGDSIFAIVGEEFGFIGASVIIILFSILLIRSFILGIKIKEHFPSIIIFGLIMLIVGQSFFNMGATLAILPLSGMPLIFISHGGTAMFFSLISIGIILNISKTVKQ